MIRFSLLLLSVFSLFLSSESLIIMCVSVGLFEFILLGIHWVSWLFRFMSFIKFWRFQPLFLHVFSLPPSLSPSSGLHCSAWLFQSSLRLCSLFSIIFLSVPQMIIYVVLSSTYLILSSSCLDLSLNPSIKCFNSINVLFGSRDHFGFFLGFLSLYWYFHFVHILFPWLPPHFPSVLWASLLQLF